IDVLQGGTQTSIQDYAGRSGHWHVGEPRSGPFDKYAFRLGNALLNNSPTVPGLEITLQGPLRKFTVATQTVRTSDSIQAQLDGEKVAMNSLVTVAAGQTHSLGRILDQGARTYLCVAGGIQCPAYLGAKATFTLGQFGGHNGRALRAGDTLQLD